MKMRWISICKALSLMPDMYCFVFTVLFKYKWSKLKIMLEYNRDACGFGECYIKWKGSCSRTRKKHHVWMQSALFFLGLFVRADEMSVYLMWCMRSCEMRTFDIPGETLKFLSGDPYILGKMLSIAHPECIVLHSKARLWKSISTHL